jgi:glutamate-1-semialdehyde 2,1-aminomutase
MNHANTSQYSKTKRAYIGGGTFSANPMTMTAGSATLSALKKNDSIYDKIGRLGQNTREKMDKIFDGKVITTGMGSLFMTHFVTKNVTKIESASDAAKCDTKMLKRFHFEMIAKDGIFFLPGKLGAFSDAHSEADSSGLAKAAERFSASI